VIELKADLHCHTNIVDGQGTPEECVERAKRKGLDVLAITDHRHAEGGLRYWREQPVNGMTVIPGEEVMTDEGHILAYFIKRTIKDCSLEEAVAKAREQGALLYATHVFHPTFRRFIWGQARKTFRDDELALLHGMETRNGQTISRCNRRATAYAREHTDLGVIGGSDAHFLWEIGGAWTMIRSQGRTLDDIKEAMLRRRTEAGGPTRVNRLVLRWAYYAHGFHRVLKGDHRRAANRRKKRRRVRRLL